MHEEKLNRKHAFFHTTYDIPGCFFSMASEHCTHPLFLITEVLWGSVKIWCEIKSCASPAVRRQRRRIVHLLNFPIFLCSSVLWKHYFNMLYLLEISLTHYPKSHGMWWFWKSLPSWVVQFWMICNLHGAINPPPLFWYMLPIPARNHAYIILCSKLFILKGCCSLTLKSPWKICSRYQHWIKGCRACYKTTMCILT